MANTIGSRIRAAREALKISQAALGKMMKVDQSTIALWETDRTTPRQNKVVELARALYLTPEVLIFGVKEPSRGAGQSVTLVGYLGDDGAITKADKKAVRQFPMPPDEGREHPPSIGAVVVDGNSHWPMYRNGDVIFHSNRKAPRDLVGLDAVIELSGGKLIVGTIATCRRRNICSIAIPNTPIRPDEEVAWAAPVVWVRRATDVSST